MSVEVRSGRNRFSRMAFLILAWVMAACVIIQTLLAGMAVFTDPMHWSRHVSFVHFFEFVPLLMLVFSFTGRLPKSLRWLSGALFGLIFVQYATANIPAAGALHPVIALVMFWVAIHTAKKAHRS